MVDMTTIPAALHRGADDLPEVDLGDGSFLQLLQVDIGLGVWVVRTRFLAGTTLPRHKHTGPVYAFTDAGSWKYLEYPEVNRPGSFLYEPAGSIHTLTVPADNVEDTVARFVIFGANLNLDDEQRVVSVYDAGSVARHYVKECRKLGIDEPPVIGLGAMP
jgi:quercetin dioxygenase-like cupin family protein